MKILGFSRLYELCMGIAYNFFHSLDLLSQSDLISITMGKTLPTQISLGKDASILEPNMRRNRQSR